MWNSQACKLLEKHSGGLLGWCCGPMTMRRAWSVLTLSRSGGEGMKGALHRPGPHAHSPMLAGEMF